jgi:hypothetical protein
MDGEISACEFEGRHLPKATDGDDGGRARSSASCRRRGDDTHGSSRNGA